MSLVQPQTVQPGGVAVMPSYTQTTTGGAVKTKAIKSAEAENAEAQRKQIEAQQDQTDIDAQKEWAEGHYAQLQNEQAEQAEAERAKLAADREEQLQLKRATQRAAEEDAEKKANLGDYWDTQSTPKRIFAAVLMGLSKGEPGGAADIYKDASARFRQREIDKFNAATLAAKGRAGDTANHEEDTKRFMLDLSAKETARDNMLQKRLATFIAQQPKAAAAGAKLTAEMGVNNAKAKLAEEIIFKGDYSRTTVDGKPAPATSPGALPSPKEESEVVIARQAAERLEAIAKAAKDNPGQVERGRKMSAKMVELEAAKKGSPLIHSAKGLFPGVFGEQVSTPQQLARTPEDKQTLDNLEFMKNYQAVQNANGNATTESDNIKAEQQVAPHTRNAEDIARLASDMAKKAREKADAMGGAIKARGGGAPAAPAAPQAPKAEAKAPVDPAAWARSPEGREFFKGNPEAAAAFRAEYAKKGKK